MRRRLPPLDQIEAFIIAANSRSFRAAADHCALSPGAFSRRIQKFSAYVGAQLFENSSGNARLTEIGRKCLTDLEPAYLELKRATSVLALDEARAGKVKISLSHGVAVGWFVPRLGTFQTINPSIEVSFKIQRDASELRRGDVDIGICASDIDLSGLETKTLFGVDCTPVAAPAVAKAFRDEGGRLTKFRLLGLATPSDVWPNWASASGFELDPATITTFDMVHAMYEFAAEGHGIALGLSPTVWPHLDSGRLERLKLPIVHYPAAYRIAATKERKRTPAVVALWRWLEAEGARTPGLREAPAA